MSARRRVVIGKRLPNGRYPLKLVDPLAGGTFPISQAKRQRPVRSDVQFSNGAPVKSGADDDGPSAYTRTEAARLLGLSLADTAALLDEHEVGRIPAYDAAHVRAVAESRRTGSSATRRMGPVGGPLPSEGEG